MMIKMFSFREPAVNINSMFSPFKFDFDSWLGQEQDAGSLTRIKVLQS